MKKYLFYALTAAGLVLLYPQLGPLKTEPGIPDTALSKARSESIGSVQQRHLSHVWAEGEGIVVRVLSDDNEGHRHQRFIVRLKNGQTLLIVHNIDIAPRLPHLKPGDTIGFRGEYIRNSKGGLLHWTHHDPSGMIPGGWLTYEGKTYR